MVVVLDANLMLAIGIRRMLCAMQELTGGSTWITPKVWHETWRRCEAISLMAAHKGIRREKKLDSISHSVELSEVEERNANDVAKRYADGWRKWMRGEASRTDSSWHLVKNVDGVHAMCSKVLKSGSLTGKKDGQENDALVIAEAMMSGAHILASHDIGTIQHDVLNAWVDKMKADRCHLFRNVPSNFAMKPDDLVAMVCKRQGYSNTVGEAGLRWAVAACRPEKDFPPDTLADIIKRFMWRNREHMPNTTEASMMHFDDLLANDPNWRETISNYPLALRTRATEGRFRDASHSDPPAP